MPDESSNIQSRKLALMNLLAGQEEGCRGQTCREGTSETHGESSPDLHTSVCKAESGRRHAAGELSSALRDGQECRGGEEAREGGDGCVPMADAVIPAETNNTVKKFYSSEK